MNIILLFNLFHSDSLDDGHLYAFSRKLTSAHDVRKLGFNILPEDKYTVNKELNETNISEATYNILNEWFKRQQDKARAYHDLCQSLREILLNLLAEDLKEIVEDEITKSDLGKYIQ